MLGKEHIFSLQLLCYAITIIFSVLFFRMRKMLPMNFPNHLSFSIVRTSVETHVEHATICMKNASQRGSLVCTYRRIKCSIPFFSNLNFIFCVVFNLSLCATDYRKIKYFQFSHFLFYCTYKSKK